ncbi:MAG: phage baseplate assembly protein V [Bacteroidota bacterium]
MSDGNDMAKLSYEIQFNGQSHSKGLIGISVNTAINKIPKARLEFNFNQFISDKCGNKNYSITPANAFDSGEENKEISFTPGTEIIISIGWEEERQQVFKGLITKHQLVVKNDGSQILTLECKHIANKMTLATKTRMLHQDVGTGSNGDEVNRVDDDSILIHLVENSDTDLTLNIQDQPLFSFDHENMIQYNCSDWDFLVMRAEATSRVCVVSGDEIILLHPKIDKPTEFKIATGDNLMEYAAELDETLIFPEVTIHSWEIDEQDMQEVSESAVNLLPDAHTVREEAFLNYPADLSVNESRAWVKNLIDRKALAKVRSTAKLKGTNGIAIGQTISLSEFARGWNKDAFVSGIKHVIVKGSWYTYVQFGLTDKKHAEIYNIAGKVSEPIMPAIPGLHYGKAVDYKKSEGGHELLEVEMSTGNESATKQTLYARLSTFSAGSNGGAIFRPYPGDEVVIGFIGNDPRFPIVLGVLYNSQDESPIALKNNEQLETGLCINDWKILINEESQSMDIASPEGQLFKIDDQNKSIQMIHDNQNAISINQKGITLESSKVVIKGSQGVEISGANITGKADSEMKLESGLTLSLEGKVSAKLKGQITQIN